MPRNALLFAVYSCALPVSGESGTHEDNVLACFAEASSVFQICANSAVVTLG